MNDLDTILTLKLKTKGFRLLSNKIFYTPYSLNIDVASMLKKKKNKTDYFYIVTSDLYQSIGSQLHFSNNIFSISPDTIFFTMKKLYNKKVPVKPRLNINFEQQYNLSDSVKFIPDSVIVSGIKNIIDTIKFVETAPITLTKINSNKYFSLEFAKKYSNYKLKITPFEIKIFIPVQKYTEASVELPVIVGNNTYNYSVKIFPENVKLTYLVSLDKYKNVTPSMFSAVVDLSNTLSSKSKKLKVNIIKYPSFVKIQKIDPEKIEYIILK
ncbi:MAG: hypothetical protein HGB12_06915 [Bacteroidetes bacterium]|nr:hypothetical protein [Bacteroidota bacterium]